MKKILIFGASLTMLLSILATGCSKKADDSSKPVSSEPSSHQEVVSSESSSKVVSEESISQAVSESTSEIVEPKTFTIEEVAEFDGTNGKPAYIVIEGIVYDVTNHSAWTDGEHAGFKAGADLTTDFVEIHGMDILEELPIVGKIA